MLRRKLLFMLGPLVVLLAATSFVAILLLHGVLAGLHHQGAHAWAVVDELGQLSASLSEVEIQLYTIQLGHERHLDKLMDAFERLRAQSRRVGEHYVLHGPVNEPIFRRLLTQVQVFEAKVSELGTAQEPARALERNREALSVAVAIRADLVQLSGNAAAHARTEQTDLATRFKWIVLGLSIAFLLVINASVLVLLRASAVILRPVERLVTASRELAAEHFDHRLILDQNDEFAELARAYNALAQQLQANERKRLEVLGMAALTLNHELNNAMGMIELQLQLVSRKSADPAAVEKSLRRIGDGLGRMSQTVESLKHIKRIVLTDYVEGTKMLDLDKSTQQDEPAVEQPAAAAAAPKHGTCPR